MQVYIIIKIKNNKKTEYMRLIHDKKFKSNGSIISFKGDNYFTHDYIINIDEVIIFIKHFNTVSDQYTIRIKNN